MPNGLARVNRERSISTLTRNLYDLSKADKKTRRNAEQALLRANPGLNKREGFVAGRAVVVPPVANLKVTARVKVQKADLDSLLNETARRLKEGENLAAEGTANAKSKAEEGLTRLSDRGLRALVKKQNPQVGKLLDKSRDGLAKKIETDSAQAKELKAAFADAQREIAVLARRARKSVKER